MVVMVPGTSILGSLPIDIECAKTTIIYPSFLPIAEVALPFAKRHLRIRCLALDKHLTAMEAKNGGKVGDFTRDCGEELW